MAGSLPFLGHEVKAKYKVSEEEMYRNNAYIEALPSVMDWELVSNRIERQPFYDKKQRLFPADRRIQLVQSVKDFVLPLPDHLILEKKISAMIRHGYKTRNPFNVEWKKQMNAAFRNLDWGSEEDGYIPLIRSTAIGFTIIGFSGLGKSTAIESILGLYPQVIQHVQYHEHPFAQKQIVWLKVDCPQDGSIKGLCLKLLENIDRVIGTDYRKQFKRYTIDQLIPEMKNIASVFGLGTLVIDEIQNLNEAKSGGAKQMLNFFTEFINEIGIPVVLVGTPRVMKILEKDFATARRSDGQGTMIWTNLIKDELWDYFVNKLWKYQWTAKETPLTEKLNQTLYEESQGIIDIAINLYKLAQWEVIGSDDEDERLTPGIIRQVAKENYRIARKALDALKSGDSTQLEGFDDLKFDVDNAFIKAIESVAISGKDNTLLNQRKTSNNGSEDDEKSPFIHIAQWLIDAGVDVNSAKDIANKTLEVFATDYNIQEAMHYAYTLAMTMNANGENSIENAEEESKTHRTIKTRNKEVKKNNPLFTKEEMQEQLQKDKGKLKDVLDL
jgi:ABC-type oligopeptide transport system ATPase subunit